MFYTKITEQTCKMVRSCGIYGLYVNNGVQKIYFFGFGYWRPGVRISTLRPKREQTALVVVCFFVGVDDENYIRALHEGVRCSNEAVEKLAFQRQVQISAEWLYLHTSTIFSAICKKISPFCKIWTDFLFFSQVCISSILPSFHHSASSLNKRPLKAHFEVFLCFCEIAYLCFLRRKF